MHGSLPWATLSVPAGAGQVTVDVSDLARALPAGAAVELYLRAASADRSFQTRQGAAPPVLEVTYVDGATASLPCVSDGFFSGSTSYSLSARADMIIGTGWVAFAPPARAVAQARLRLTALAGSASTVAVFRLRKPVDVVIPATGGLAGSYLRDQGVASHPAVIRHFDFTGPESSWKVNAVGDRNNRVNYDPNPDAPSDPTKLPLLHKGKFIAPNFTDTYSKYEVVDGDTYRGYGFQPLYPGQRALHAWIPPNDTWGVEWEMYLWPLEQDLYLRYYVRLGDNFVDNVDRGDGLYGDLKIAGKFGPGFAHRSLAGNGGAFAEGKDGWSMRGNFLAISNRADPKHGHVALGDYVYMVGENQVHSNWGRGGLGVLERARWYCIERRMRMNTPGRADGITQAWVDGKLAHERTNMRWRDLPPYARGHSYWRDVFGDMGIASIWFDWYNGGVNPPPNRIDAFFSDIVVSRERIGPMGGLTIPAPAPSPAPAPAPAPSPTPAPAPSPAPVDLTAGLAVAPQSLPAGGGSLTVTWSTAGAASVTINGTAVALSGSQTGSVVPPLLVTLIATAADGRTVSRTVSVDVEAPAPAPGPAPAPAPAPAPVPAPPGAIPAWVPAPGEVRTYRSGDGVLANTFASIADPERLYDPFHTRKVTDYSCTVLAPDFGTHGARVIWGAGHAATNYNGMTALVESAAGLRFELLATASRWGVADQGDNQAQINAFGEHAGSSPLRLASPHSYGGGDVVDGRFVQIMSMALGYVGLRDGRAAHALDLSPATAPAARAWSRLTGSTAAISPFGAPNLTRYVPAQRRIYFVTRGGGAPFPVRWFDLATNAYVTGTGRGFAFAEGGVDTGALVHVPERGLLLCLYRSAAGALVVEWMDVTVPQPTVGGRAVLATPLSVPDTWGAACWCGDAGRLLIFGAVTGRVHEVTIPTLLSATWPVDSHAAAIAPPATSVWGKSADYNPRTRTVTLLAAGLASSGPDAVTVYRPRGT